MPIVTKSKWTPLLLWIPIIALFVFGSCRKCKEGCDTVFTTNAAALKFSDTIVDMNKVISATNISFEKIVTKSNGDRDCKYKNEVSCNSDGLSIKNLHLFCNKELVLGGKTYPMNTDLLLMPELVKSSNSNAEKLPFVVLQTDAAFPAGRYHFILQGQTDQGKEFEDIGVITWQ